MEKNTDEHRPSSRPKRRRSGALKAEAVDSDDGVYKESSSRSETSGQHLLKRRKRVRWVLPSYPKVVDYSLFCQTREDFHTKYGLSLNGIDPAIISERSITESDWLSVFKVTRVRGKVKLRHVRPELFDAVMVLHQKVYQEIPVNHELAVLFARAFAYEYCTTAKRSENKTMYKVARAIAAEASVERCKKMGTLQQKMQRFLSRASDVDMATTKPTMVEPLDEMKPTVTSCFKSDSSIDDRAVALLETVHERLEAEKGKLNTMKADLDVANLDKAARSIISTVLEEFRKNLQSAKTKLSLEADLDNVKKIQLEAEVRIYTRTLERFGVDDNGTDRVVEIQAQYDNQLHLISQLSRQQEFVSSLLRMWETHKLPNNLPLPSPVYPTTMEFIVSSACFACGLNIQDKVSFLVHLRPCGHTYHHICFAVMCKTRNQCLGECKTNIPIEFTKQCSLGYKSNDATPMEMEPDEEATILESKQLVDEDTLVN